MIKRYEDVPQWQPISESEKVNGEVVLLMFEWGRVSTGYWERVFNTWVSDVEGEDLTLYYDEPTHFMPLDKLRIDK